MTRGPAWSLGLRGNAPTCRESGRWHPCPAVARLRPGGRAGDARQHHRLIEYGRGSGQTNPFVDDELFSGVWADRSDGGRLPQRGRRAKRPAVPRGRPAQLGGAETGDQERQKRGHRGKQDVPVDHTVHQVATHEEGAQKPDQQPNDQAGEAIHPLAGQQRHDRHQHRDGHQRGHLVAHTLGQRLTLDLAGQHLLQRPRDEQIQHHLRSGSNRDRHPEHRDASPEPDLVHAIPSDPTRDSYLSCFTDR